MYNKQFFFTPRHENIITPFSWLSQGYVYMSHTVYLHPESVKVNLRRENSKLSFELSLKNKQYYVKVPSKLIHLDIYSIIVRLPSTTQKLHEGSFKGSLFWQK